MNQVGNTSFKNNANKAYLPASAVPAAQGAANFSFLFAGTTAIEGVEVENEVKAIFDLTGRRLEAITAPGIYIINGVKGKKYCMNSECPSRAKTKKENKDEVYPRLDEYFDLIIPLDKLENEISRCILSETEIADDAIPTNSNLTIYGIKGSVMEEYAAKKRIKFVDI